MVSVQSVFRYPVKSMLGIPVEAASLRDSGVTGDRRWALVDTTTGKVASAKQPRLWRRLLQVRVEQPGEGAQVVMVLPDGTRLVAGAPGTDRALSQFLDRPVEMRSARHAGAEIDRAVPDEVLERGVDADVGATLVQLSGQTPGHGFVDLAPVHLVTTGTLDAIAAVTGRRVDPRVLRPNLLLTTPEANAYVENDWVGAQVTVGEQVRLQVFKPTARCAVPTLQHGDVPADPDVLRTLAQHNRIPVEGLGALPSAGVYAKVLTGGTVHPGDPVQVHLAA
jgi:uncharacterized protein